MDEYEKMIEVEARSWLVALCYRMNRYVRSYFAEYEVISSDSTIYLRYESSKSAWRIGFFCGVASIIFGLGVIVLHLLSMDGGLIDFCFYMMAFCFLWLVCGMIGELLIDTREIARIELDKPKNIFINNPKTERYVQMVLFEREWRDEEFTIIMESE